MALPSMLVSSSTSPPYSRTLRQVSAMSSTLTETWVRPGSFIVRSRKGSGAAPDPAKWSSSSTNPSIRR